MTARELPEGVAAYGQSPTFTASTLPTSLATAHSTKAGVWGRLCVTAGEVRYFLEGASDPLAVIGAGETFIIPPQERHFVALSDAAAFHVEFCKAADAETPASPHQ